MVRRKNLLIDGRTAGETKYITLAGQITVWRKEDRLEECRPIVRGQIGVRDGDWDRCSAGFGRNCFDLRNGCLHWQK